MSQAALGPLMIGVAGHTLSALERTQLQHPLVGGVILFARNFTDPEQLSGLCGSIKAIKDPELLIAVDHEGGRVQRFKSGFTHLPAMSSLGVKYDQDPRTGLEKAHEVGETLAKELLAHRIDLSMGPVVDLASNAKSTVIGDRSFHADPNVVGLLAEQVILGMNQQGMQAVAKHCPGHGFVAEDTHLQSAQDPRGFDEIWEQDLVPYRYLAQKGRLQALMMSHVIYPQIDGAPASFSKIWMASLRERLEFSGAIISDDLGMQAATLFQGDIVAATRGAIETGCDLILLCNQPQDTQKVLDHMVVDVPPASLERLAKLRAETR